MNERWVRVAPCEWIPPREGRSVRIGDRDIAIFNVDDETFLATDNTCPHKGGPLCDGIITGRSVVCPLHAWKIDLDSGAVVRPGGVDHPGVQTYPVRVEGGIVKVCLPDEPIHRQDLEKIQNCHIVQA
jgi:nitrite reductase (NADH) small subunit